MGSDSENSFGWENADEPSENSKTENSKNKICGKMKTKIKVENISDDESSPQSLNDLSKSINGSLNEPKNKSREFQNKNTSNLINSKTKMPEISRTHLPHDLRGGPDLHYNSSDTKQKNQALLKNYLTANSQISQSAAFCESMLGDDEDIWLVQCPKKIDINKLQGINILGKDKKKIKLGGSTFECISLANRKDKLPLLIPPSSSAEDPTVVSFQINGVLVIKERVPNISVFEIGQEIASTVPFPTNLKTRHPIFGVDYKNMVKLPKSVKAKFTSPIKKLKRKNDVPPPVVEGNNKKVKRKRSFDAEESFQLQKKVKKESLDFWTSETSIENSLFNLPTKSVKREKR